MEVASAEGMIKRIAKLIGIGIAVGIFGFIAIGGWIWLGRTVMFVAKASKTSGTIVEVIREKGRYGSVEYRPIYKFADASGVVHTQRSLVSSSPPSFEVGETVGVLYEVAQPTHSNIDSFGELWLGPVVFSGIGFLIVGIIIFPHKTKPRAD